MKNHRNSIFLALLLAGSLAAILLGCATKNPEYAALTPAQVATNTTIPQYVIDPRLSSISNTVKGVADAVAPANPYAGITRTVVDFGFGLVAIVSGLLVKKKNGTIDTLAAGAVKAGVGQAILDHASNSDHFVAVADAINAQTGANQTNTGAPKT